MVTVWRAPEPHTIAEYRNRGAINTWLKMHGLSRILITRPVEVRASWLFGRRYIHAWQIVRDAEGRVHLPEGATELPKREIVVRLKVKPPKLVRQ